MLPCPQLNFVNVFGFAEVQTVDAEKTKWMARRDHPFSGHPFLVKFGIFSDFIAVYSITEDRKDKDFTVGDN